MLRARTSLSNGAESVIRSRTRGRAPLSLCVRRQISSWFLRTSAARAVMAATSTIPVVFLSGDPVATGLVKSLARPGGNATGVSVVSPEMTAKRLDLLHQLIPHARRIAFLRNPSNANVVFQLAEAQKAARQLGMHLETFDARSAAEIDISLRAIRRSGPDAILVASDLGLLTEKERIVSSIRKARIPTVFPWREYHRYGALMSYGPNLKEALHAYRVLCGQDPQRRQPLRFACPRDLQVRSCHRPAHGARAWHQRTARARFAR